MNTRKNASRRIVAEVWDRSTLAVPHTKPRSRHTTVGRALRAQYQYMLLGFDCVVLAKEPDHKVFVPLVSWKPGIRTKQDREWVFNGQRFHTQDEAARAASDIHSRWTAVTETTVYPSMDKPNYRWDDLTGRAVPIDNPATATVDAPATAPSTPALPPVEQALRDVGVQVECPSDPTEATRRVLVAEINHEPGSREALEAKYGCRMYDKDELCAEFDVLSFRAPMIVVRRRSDGVVGTMTFQHLPRFYWGFEEDK